MSTGLLSLNVHEPLAFEGTEICLHPEIFQQSVLSAVPGGSIGTRHSVSSTSNTASSATVGVLRNACVNSVSSGRLHGLAHLSSNEKGPFSASDGVARDSRRLQPGDVIMIRVWDPLPSDQRVKSTSIQRQSSPVVFQAQAATVSNNALSTNQSSSAGAPVLNVPSLESSQSTDHKHQDLLMKTSNLTPKSQNDNSQKDDCSILGGSAIISSPTARDHSSALLSSGSLRSPEFSPRASPPLSTEETELTTAASGLVEKSVASCTRPPVVPRGRSSGLTSNSLLGSMSSKSIVVPGQPGPASHSLQSSRVVTSIDSFSRARISPVPSSMHPKTRHIRDLSDISTDTTFGFAFGQGGGSQSPSIDTTKTVMLGDGEGDDTLTEIANTHSLRVNFVMLVTEKSLKGIKASSRTHVSILRQVADLYNLSTYDIVTVQKLVGRDAENALQAASADFVLVTIKDQFLSRGELHFFQDALIGSWIYEGQRLFEPSRGIHANAREIRHEGINVCSGILTESTNIVFRSRSSRIFWLVQMSAEMWDFASPFQASQKASYCEIYFDKFISFVYDLFEKWEHAEVTHKLTVVFFSRTFLTGAVGAQPEYGSTIRRDIYGRRYEDHCRIVIENETRTDWDALVVRMKQAFMSYPSEVGWNLASGVGARKPSNANQGNLLEAVNVTLNLLQYHFLDRDLHRTGNSIVVVSAGNGVFEVDKKLAKITYQRMMDNGIGSDMLSLGLPPLHIAPFFLYFNEFHEVESEIPHWINLSFISYENNESLVALTDAGDEVPGKEDPESAAASTSAQGPQGGAEPRVSTRNEDQNDDKPQVVEVEPKVNKERHLEDRDIRDILEACRPRATGMLPRALQALLRMYQAGEANTEKTTPLSNQDGGDLNIKEWDGIDLNEVNKRKTLVFASLDRREQSKLHGPASPPSLVEVERMESATQSSSFTSQLPHLMLGTSYERHFLAQDNFSTFGQARMQRAISLCFPNEDPCRGSTHGHGRQSESEEDDPSFRQFVSEYMRNHDRDKMLPAVKSPKIIARQQELDCGIQDSTHSSYQGNSQGQATTIKTEQLSSLGSSTLGPVTVRHAAPPGVSGIGAALSHYSSNIARETLESERSALPRSFERTRTLPTRSSSVGRVVSPLLNTSDLAPRTLSPLVLPPPVPSISGHFEAPFAPGMGPYPNERRFIRAQDLPKALLDDARNIVSGVAFDGGNLSATPENMVLTQGGPGFKKPHLENTTRNPSSPINESRIARMQPSTGLGRASRSPNSRRPVSPKSDLRIARTRRRSGSVGKPLASDNFRRTASPSPITRRYASPSSEARLARTRQQSGSVDNQLAVFDGARRRASPSPETRTRTRQHSSSIVQHMGSRSRSSSQSLATLRDSSGSSSTKHSATARRRKAINPFRQQEEDEVLSQKSHNSRRWSHVFPLGEIEFKRKAGPNWKSLAAPAALPLSIDYFPPRREREHKFTFSIYNVTLSEFENKNFSSNKELLLEMVRQRITQDYQFVPSYLIDDSDEEARSLVQEQKEGISSEAMCMYLSLGHRLQVLYYDPTSDTVEVKTYMAKNAQGSQVGTFRYLYKSYCRETKSYVKMVQDFKQVSSPYNWNKVDRIICGDEDREMREGMRFKRLMFVILPDRHSDVETENAYVVKFKKLLDYFEKLRAKEETKSPLNVKIETSQDKQRKQGRPGYLSAPGIAGNSMVRFYVPFRKGRREQLEYLEVSIDSTLNTSWSYRIIFNWFVASAGKVDTQVQLLQRRCNQFRLNLIASSEVSVSKMLFLNPFRSPVIFTVADTEKVANLDEKLAELDYIHDGVFATSRDFIDCIDHGAEFDFGSKWSKLPAGQQVIHRSGALYVRIVQDRNGRAVVFAIANNVFIQQKDDSMQEKYERVFEQLRTCMQEVAD